MAIPLTIIHEGTVQKESLEVFAEKLLYKILHAPEEKVAHRYISAALRAMHNKKINGYIIQRFVDRMLLSLDGHIAASAPEAANASHARKRLKKTRKKIGAGESVKEEVANRGTENLPNY